MSSDSPGGGCLTGPLAAVFLVAAAPFLALYAFLTGKGGDQAREQLRLPYLAISKMHSEDRQALNRARRSGEQCLETLYGKAGEEFPESMVRETAEEVRGLVAKVYEVGERLAEARSFARQHDPDQIAREQADLELKMEEASGLDEKRGLDQAAEALADRARHAATISQEIRSLSAQLSAGSRALEALHAQLSRVSIQPDDASARTDTLLREVRGHQRDASRALEAYAATAREVSRLR